MYFPAVVLAFPVARAVTGSSFEAEGSADLTAATAPAVSSYVASAGAGSTAAEEGLGHYLPALAPYGHKRIMEVLVGLHCPEGAYKDGSPGATPVFTKGLLRSCLRKEATCVKLTF